MRALRRLTVTVALLLALAAPAWAQGIWQRTSGTISTAGTTCATATNCVVLTDVTRTGGGTIVLTGTFVGTAQFEGSLDGTTWFALSVFPQGSTVAVTSATATGQWSFPLALVGVRVRASALTSGSITVAMVATSARGAGGSGGAPSNASYVTTTAEAGLTNETALGSLTTGLLLNTVAAGVGTPSAYGGTSCTNQFPRSLDASGAATCASITATDLGTTLIPQFAGLGVGTAGISGQIVAPDGAVGSPAVTFTTQTNLGLYRNSTDVIAFATAGTFKAAVTGSHLVMRSDVGVTWVPGTDPTASPDVILKRDGAANILALVNGTTGQNFRVYGTTTGPQYALLSHDGSNGYIGTNGDLPLRPYINGAGRWKFEGSATLYGFQKTASNGATWAIREATTTVNAAAGATISTAANFIPAGAVLKSVTTRVTTAFGTTNGLTSISVGDGTTPTAFSNATGITLGTTTNSTNAAAGALPKLYTGNTAIVITGNGGTGFDATGVIRIVIIYEIDTAPTS